MNYTIAASGSGLTYNIKQITLNLSAADFTKLNTSPIILIAADASNFICVLNTIYQYDNIGANSLTYIYAGFEPLLASASNTGSSILWGSQINGQLGCLNFALPTYNGQNNTITNSPLVLWSPTDDSGLFFNTFQMTLTYYTIPSIL